MSVPGNVIHTVRWTAEKIAQRIRLIELLVYRRRQSLPPFRHIQLSGPLDAPPVGLEVDDSSWAVVEQNTYWGHWFTDFVLRSRFQLPTAWPDEPVALYLPLGISGDFSHPESLVYIDGVAYATCDRHHQEISLPSQWRDGQSHLLALHGWTGLGGFERGEPYTQLFMYPCASVQIDQPTRDFIAMARVALGVANALDGNDPAKGRLLDALVEAFKILDTREPFDDGFYSSSRPAWIISLPSRLAGASTTVCLMTASGGRGWMARAC